MAGKRRIIFDNIHPCDKEEARNIIWETNGEEENPYEWTTPEDISDDEVFATIDRWEQEQYDDWVIEFSAFLHNRMWLACGTVGRWDGTFSGGKLFSSFSELMSGFSDCDYFIVYDVNGHLYINGYHHDGVISMEIKELTPKGEDYASRHCWDMSDRELHEKLWNEHWYTRLPNYAYHTFGCKRVEYEKTS